jgi:hypothetical protein
MIERQEESQETYSLWSINPRRRAMYLDRLREVFADVLVTDDARVFVGVPSTRDARGRGEQITSDGRRYEDVTFDLIYTDAGVEIDSEDPDELIGLLRTGLSLEPFDDSVDCFTPEYVVYAAECRAAMRG